MAAIGCWHKSRAARFTVQPASFAAVWSRRNVSSREVAQRTGTVVGCHLQRHGLAMQGNVIAKIAGLRRLMPCGCESSPDTPDQVRIVENWKEGV